MRPTHTKFLSRYEAELLSSICLATKANEIAFDQVWLGSDRTIGHTPTIEPSFTALISINSPDSNDEKEAHIRFGFDGEPKVDGFWKPLKLVFHDIDPSGCGEEFLRRYKLFDEEQAGRVLDYLIEVESAENVYAVWAHCQAGISRSAGMSKFIADIYQLWYPESYSLYNKHVYRTLTSAYTQRVLQGKPVPAVRNKS